MKSSIEPIIGEYVNLRQLTLEDALITLTWRSSARAGLLNRGATTLQEQAKWIASRSNKEINFIIELKDKTPVGMLSLVDIDDANKRAESARFLIGDEKSVKGIPVAVESMKLLYELAFNTLSLERIYGTIASENTLMIKWQKYLGMKEEGRLRNHYFINNSFQDAVCLGILSKEFKEVALPKMKTLISMARTQLNK